jgi:hypothetical protein
MILKAKCIGVDAGMIIVCDYSYFKKDRDDLNALKLGDVFEVPNGKYKVKYEIPNTWPELFGGEVCEGNNETLKVTSGKIVVIDPCYVIAAKLDHDGWIAWLDETSYGETLNTDKAFIISSMGGDGCYDVYLNLTKIK